MPNDVASILVSIGAVLVAAVSAWIAFLGIRASKISAAAARVSAEAAQRAASASEMAAQSAARLADLDEQRAALEREERQRERIREEEQERIAAESVLRFDLPVRSILGDMLTGRRLIVRNASRARVVELNIRIIEAIHELGKVASFEFSHAEPSANKIDGAYRIECLEPGRSFAIRVDAPMGDLFNCGPVVRCRISADWVSLGNRYEREFVAVTQR